MGRSNSNEILQKELERIGEDLTLMKFYRKS